MTMFHEREAAFEAKFAHDAQMYFNACARRNRLAGLWAAGLLDLRGQAAAQYARDLVQTGLDAPDDGGVLARLVADLQPVIAAGGLDARTIGDRLAACMIEAREQLMAEYAPGPAPRDMTGR